MNKKKLLFSELHVPMTDGIDNFGQWKHRWTRFIILNRRKPKYEKNENCLLYLVSVLNILSSTKSMRPFSENIPFNLFLYLPRSCHIDA